MPAWYLFLAYKIQSVLLLHFLLAQKKDFIQFFIFLLNLLIDFENHLKGNSFWKLSELFICYSFMILSQIFNPCMLLTL